VQPKTPLPVVSVWLPAPGYDEFRANAQEFMQGLANPEIGGFYDVVRSGQGAAKGPKLVTAVRTRFNQMHIVKWRVSCISPSVTQTFKLVFSNTTTPIAGDSTFRDVPMGIDPTAWPLDINADYTQKMAQRDPVQPGGKFTIYGDFCWGGDKDRAEVYFVSSGTQPPQTLAGTDIEAAKRTQQQLIASGLRGRAIQSSDRDVVFEAPDQDKILTGSGSSMVTRLVVYDNKAQRMSGVTATSILALHAQERALPWLWIVGGAFGVVVLLLLLVIMLRSGKKRPAGPAPQPMIAGAPPFGAQGGYGAPPPQPYGAAGNPGFGPPQPYVPPPAQPYGPPAGYAPAGPAVPAFGAPGPLAPAGAPGADFMYGGQQGAQYGLTMAQPEVAPPPPDPYGAPPAPAGVPSVAVLSGPSGTYTISAGTELALGRDGNRCQIVLNEPRISGFHATLRLDTGQLFVRDEQSNNGTFLDGQRLAPNVWTPAPPGSALRFGPVEFGVRLE
jgi:hypothetical protein